MPDLPSIDRLLARQEAWVDKYIGPWFGAIFLFAILRVLLEKAANVHWAVGLVATLVFAALLTALLLGWRRRIYMKYSSEHSRNDAGVLLLSTVLLAIVVFAAFSTLIYQFSPQSYSGRSVISMGTLTDYYGWVTLDAIPGIRFSDTFHVARPLEHHGLVAASCLLIFRLLVLGTLLKALKEWLTPAATAA